jgi:hypothetical protein
VKNTFNALKLRNSAVIKDSAQFNAELNRIFEIIQPAPAI